jgi:IS30 family transposase
MDHDRHHDPALGTRPRTTPLATPNHPTDLSKHLLSNVPDATPQKVIGAYQNLYKIEKTFRMAKSDLAVRPVYHRLRESIDAHLNVVFAAMAVGHWIETTTGWSIKKFVTTARRYRTTWIKLGTQILPAIKPLSDDLREALDKIEQANR